MFDDNWSVYESYLADYCPQNVQPFPSGGGGAGVDGKYGETSKLYAVHANDVLLLFTLHVHARNVYENELLLDPTFSGVCHSRERIGYTMSSYAVTGRGHVGALTDCSQECQKDSSCNSFSFR